jgi:hypothetical protein
VLLDRFTIDDLYKGSECSNTKSTVFCLTDPSKVIQMAKADDLLRLKDIVMQTAEEVCAACMDFRTFGGKLLDGLFQRLWLHIGEIRHGHGSSLLPAS